MRSPFLIWMLFANVVLANELIVPNQAPSGIESLPVIMKSHNAPNNSGAHGLTEYCYINSSFVVYAFNLLGHGYQLSSGKPEGLKCIAANKSIPCKNTIGMYIDMPKSEVQKLLGNIQISDNQVIIWQSKVLINGINYDLQTYAEFRFNNNKLSFLSVFTTETN
jgi:hypothetical protein